MYQKGRKMMEMKKGSSLRGMRERWRENDGEKEREKWRKGVGIVLDEDEKEERKETQ